jgi:hypothetical protein
MCPVQRHIEGQATLLCKPLVICQSGYIAAIGLSKEGKYNLMVSSISHADG